MDDHSATQKDESGVALIAVLVVLTPLVLLVGSFTSAMDGRTKRLEAEMARERALLIAEAGIDLAVWYAHTGHLTHGLQFTGTLGLGNTYQVECTHLLQDGVDNDGINGMDALDPNEDVYMIEVHGTAGNEARRIAAYLGPQSHGGGISSDAAMMVMNPAITIDMKGTPMFDGSNHNIDGTLPGSGNKYGLALADDGVAPAETTAPLLAELSPGEASLVVGVGGAPSVTVSGGFTPTDLANLTTDISNTADVVLTNNKYTSHDIGDAGAGDFKTMYRSGDLEVKGNCEWAGVLVVDGDFKVGGNFRFDGIVIVTGNMDFGAGTVMINGGVIMGPSSSMLQVKGTLDVRYSEEAWNLAAANLGATQYVLWNGWQELAR